MMKPGDKVRVQLTPDGGYFDAVLEELVRLDGEPECLTSVWRIRIGSHFHLISGEQIHAN